MKKIVIILLVFICHIGYSNQIVLNIKANDMLYLKSKDRLYVTVGGTDLNYGNELLIVNPHTGVIEKDIYVGSEPGEIKISSNEEYIYIILTGTPQIVRLKLGTLSVDKYILVNSVNSTKQYYAKHMAVLTNNPKDIVVTRSEGSYVQDVRLFKDGIMQKDSIGYFPAYSISVLLNGTSNDTIYGYNDQSTGYDFSMMQVTPTGLKYINSYSNLLSGFSQPKLFDNLLYSCSGDVVNPILNPPIQIGKCTLDDSFDDVAVNSSINEALYARLDFWQDNLLHVSRFNNKKFSLKSKKDISIDNLSKEITNGKISSLTYINYIEIAFIVKDNFSKNTNIVITSLKSLPVITWNNPADITYGTLLDSKQLNSTANVAGSFVYTPASGSTLKVGLNQELKVDFTPSDTGSYLNTSKIVHINVVKIAPEISWVNPNPITYGTLLDSKQLNATANVPGSFVYTPASGTTLDVGQNQELKVEFTPSDTSIYLQKNKIVYINVQQIMPEISWEDPADITYGTLLGSTQLNATANVEGKFVYLPVSGTKLIGGRNQELKVNFFPTDSIHYLPAQKIVYISVLSPNGETILTNNPLVIYPNPTNDVITISGLCLEGFYGTINYSILNNEGKTLHVGKIDNLDTIQTINVAYLPKGLFILKIETNKGAIIRRFVKE